MRRTGLVLGAVLLAATLTTPAALADGAKLRDRNDTRGVLDVSRISHGHRTTRAGEHQLVHTIRLHDPWPVKKLRDHGFALIYFELAGHPDNPPERTLQIEYEDRRLVAHMYNSMGDPSKHMRKVALWRPDWRTVRVAFPKALLRKSLQRYKWNAVTFVDEREGMCSRGGGCTDWAPNLSDGLEYVRHVL